MVAVTPEGECVDGGLVFVVGLLSLLDSCTVRMKISECISLSDFNCQRHEWVADIYWASILQVHWMLPTSASCVRLLQIAADTITAGMFMLCTDSKHML